MEVKPFLTRLVVVGGNRQHRIGAAVFGALGEFDRLEGIVGARPRHYWHSAVHRFHRQIDDALVFIKIEGGGFSCRTAWDNTVYAVLNLKFDQIDQPFLVELAIDKWGHQGS